MDMKLIYNNKEFHLFLYDTDEVEREYMCCSFLDTLEAINRGDPYIYTYSVACLNAYLFDLEYRVFVWYDKTNCEELREQTQCANIIKQCIDSIGEYGKPLNKDKLS
jgi:hypothetical protein